MKKTLGKITVVFAWTLLMLNIFSVAFINVGSAIYIPDYEPIDIGPQLRESDFEINLMSLPDDYGTGNPTKLWLSLDDYNGYYFFDMFELRAVGTVAEIWVQVDLSWPAGDPRSTPVVTDAQVAYLLAEFENNIYPTDTSYFGVPDSHDGTFSLLEAWGYVPPGYYFESTGRNVILVSNIEDENYYDYTYPYYIAGFFSTSLEAYFDRNVISIDSYNWEDRIGPGVPRPYLYESVITHEYQHLIHADYNPGDPSFLNEGLSMFAEILCGYPTPWGDINSYLTTPDNSLTEWGDQGGINILADYGAAMLFAVYLNDQFGPTFLRDFLQAGIPDIDGLNVALAPFSRTFEDVYYDWRIANWIHANTPGEGRYNYKSIDLGSPEAIPISYYYIRTHDFPIEQYGSDFGETYTILGYPTGVYDLGPYSSDYILFNDWDDTASLSFDGDDFTVYGWRMTAEGWWSSAANLMDTLMVGTAYVDPKRPTLKIVTKYDIEPLWDFGFVQVSTDGGVTWASLENRYTTYDHDPSAHPDIVANLPGLTGTSRRYPRWMTMNFDLEEYAGETVMIGFRYMTDWAALYDGWYISEASVSREPMTLSPVLTDAEFQVTIIYQNNLEDMVLDPTTETGEVTIEGGVGDVIVIISNVAEHGMVDYAFSAIKT